MNKYTIDRQVGQINDAADMLQAALKKAQDILQSDDCPEPYERWDDAAETAGFAAGDIDVGDFGEQITAVIDALLSLQKEME
jgi:hypothetical protein